MPMPETLEIEDDIIDDGGNEDDAESPDASAEDDDETVAPPARRAASTPMDQMVPMSVVEATANAAANAAVQRSQPAPAPRRRAGLVDPNADATTQKFQRDMESAIGPGLSAMIEERASEIAAPAIQTSLAQAEASDLAQMQANFEDYDADMEAAVQRMRIPFCQRANTWLPRLEFYDAVVGQHTREARKRKARGVAVKREAAPARDHNQPPAQGRKQRRTIDANWVKTATPEQIKAAVFKLNPRII